MGLSEPKNWSEELSNCQALLDAGIKCYSIGTKYLWTAGGWFDLLIHAQMGMIFILS